MRNDGNPSGTSVRPLLASVGASSATGTLQDHPKHNDATQNVLPDHASTCSLAPNSEENGPTNSGVQATSISQAPSTHPDLLASSPQVAISGPQSAADEGKTQFQASSAQSLGDQTVERRRERLDALRRSFETIGTRWGSIPILGFYVGAGAKVGLAVVKVIQTMDSKPEIANELEVRMTRLSEVLGRLAKLPGDPQRVGFLETITELRSELQALGKIIQELNKQAALQEVFLSSDQAEALRLCQDMIGAVLEGLQPFRWFTARARL